MPILTKPATINKNEAASLSLDKALLKAHAAITDSYYQDDSNWSRVVFNYKNSFGQRETVIFDATEASPAKNFLVSASARGDFQLQSISIYDKDGGKFKIKRASLDTSFDVSFAPAVNPVIYNRMFTTNPTFVTGESVSDGFTLSSAGLDGSVQYTEEGGGGGPGGGGGGGGGGTITSPHYQADPMQGVSMAAFVANSNRYRFEIDMDFNTADLQVIVGGQSLTLSNTINNGNGTVTRVYYSHGTSNGQSYSVINATKASGWTGTPAARARILSYRLIDTTLE